jgi:succinyl-CoA synthetase beta subunit
VVCFDAKMGFDDNAAFRQKAIFAQEDTAEMDPREVGESRVSVPVCAVRVMCMVGGRRHRVPLCGMPCLPPL